LGGTAGELPGEGPNESLIEQIQDPDERERVREEAGRRDWSAPAPTPTTLVLVRHGVTTHTTEKRFSGGLASANPGLSDEGRAQVTAVADWLAPLAERVDAVVSSPVRRTRESADILGRRLGHEVVEEPGFAEMEFGSWDGLTFTDVAERHQADLEAWLGSLDVAPGGTGESFRTVEARVLAGLQRLLEAHPGKTLVVVSHVTPIKTLVAHAVDAPLLSVFRMELTPASVTVLSFYPGEDGPRASLRMYNALPPGATPFVDPARW
jgi:ribonuclease H / adenosylcobalamin/alpha-ribazole phosphatase